ncbi:hypothetical protein P3S68_012099 [Capsicum galapagoense]
MDNELKKTMQTSTPGPPSAINSSKENNVSQDIGVIERMAPLLPKSPSRSQSTLVLSGFSKKSMADGSRARDGNNAGVFCD